MTNDFREAKSRLIRADRTATHSVRSKRAYKHLNKTWALESATHIVELHQLLSRRHKLSTTFLLLMQRNLKITSSLCLPSLKLNRRDKLSLKRFCLHIR